MLGNSLEVNIMFAERLLQEHDTNFVTVRYEHNFCLGRYKSFINFWSFSTSTTMRAGNF